MGTLVAVHAAGPHGHLLSIRTPAETTRAFVNCGQYCALGYAGEVGYFAIARAPGPGPLEFYVKDGGALSQAPPGAAIDVSAPAGAGYAVSPARPLVVVATGSGIGAVRGVLQTHPVDALYAGFRYATDVPFADELAALAARGVAVTIALSREAGGRLPAGSRAYRGYVQDALAADEPRLERGQLVACGQPEMQAAARAVGLELGLDPAAFLTNY